MKINLNLTYSKYSKFRLQSPILKSLKCDKAIFGGAVRSWSLDKAPRDIDIAVDMEKEELLERFPGVKQNKFGGLKLSENGIEIDIWPLKETWTLKDAGLEPTFHNMAKTASFNTDCIIFLITRDGSAIFHEVLDYGFKDAMEQGLLKVNYPNNPAHMHNALRGFRQAQNLGLEFGDCFLKYFRDNVKYLDIAQKKYEEYYKEPFNLALAEKIKEECPVVTT